MSKAVATRVLVVGGGFAGLWATRALAADPVEITLVERSNHHLFQPLLYQVATAGLSAPDIAAPLRHILRTQANVTVLMQDVVTIDKGARCIVLADGSSLDYDLLILASGVGHSYFGHDDWAAHAPGLKTLNDALSIRRKLLLAFERAELESDAIARRAWLNFVIVGGGPTGVELAGTLAEIARHTLRREFRRIDPADAKILLIEAGSRVLSNFPESLSINATQHLQRLGVEVRTSSPVSSIDGDGVSLPDGKLNARTVLWAAGIAASPLGAALGVPLDRAGRVVVAEDLSVPGHPEIFVAGDLAAIAQQGKPVPGVAPAAKQMGTHVARVIRARSRGVASPAFHYRDFGNLATIGRSAAVVDLGHLKFSGRFAWWFWLLAHVFFLIGFRNRILVLINWAWSYWTYQRHARIVVGDVDASRSGKAQ
ncbi:NAD(P)/FAD-dependent oxidoreductase [Dokdonella sp.]|uniref:NAD(P)/FAD-dependent oxidoreductase n=1 Tax=Dokdonella sp. TaxID=2291710 RepID=UPI003C421500